MTPRPDPAPSGPSTGDPPARGRVAGSRYRNRARALLFDSPSEPSFDRTTALVAELLRVPVALISLVDTERQFFKSSVGLPEPWCSRRETPLSHSFCQYVVIRDEPLVIDDARLHPLVRDSLAIPDLDVIAYAGMPIHADGETIGSLCAIDSRPRAWSQDDLRILESLTSLVEELIALRTGTIERQIELDTRARVHKRREERQAAAHRATLREKRAIEWENQRLQRSLLPRPRRLDVNGFSVSTVYRPGSRHLLVGGDFADIQPRRDGGLDFIIGDVTGHGPEAAALGIALRVTWTALLPEFLDSDEIIARLNAAIFRERLDDGMMATALVGSISPDGTAARLTIAGHPAPILTGGTPRQIGATVARGTLLGYREHADWPSATIALTGGLLVYTDGLTDYSGAEGRGAELLTEDVARHLEDPRDQLLPDHLVDAATARFGAPLKDDVAALHIQRTV